MANPPADCWARLMSSPATVTAESALTLHGVDSLPSTDSGMEALTSRIESIINEGLSDGAQVISISNVSFENGEVSYKAEIGYDSSKTSEGSIEATAVGAAESPPTTSPTPGPTGTPTQSPTKNPTLSPTAGPSPSPTGSPMEGPCLKDQPCCDRPTCTGPDPHVCNVQGGSAADVPCGAW